MADAKTTAPKIAEGAIKAAKAVKVKPEEVKAYYHFGKGVYSVTDQDGKKHSNRDAAKVAK